MLGNPDVVGEDDAFDWAPLEGYLSDTASRNSHAVFRVYMHFPGRPLRVPQYLNDAGLNYNGDEPDYESPILQEALVQFIDALAARYDGDTRIFAIQAGLIGKWYVLKNSVWMATKFQCVLLLRRLRLWCGAGFRLDSLHNLASKCGD